MIRRSHDPTHVPARARLRVHLAVAMCACALVSGEAWGQADVLWSALPVHTFASPRGVVSDVRFSPVGSRLAISAESVFIDIWSTGSGERVGRIDNGNGSSMYMIAYSPDGLMLALAARGDLTVTYEAETGNQLRQLDLGRQTLVRSVAFAPDGNRLATGSSDHQARVWDAASGALLLALPHLSSVEMVAFLASSRRLITGTEENIIRIWDLDTGLATQLPTSDDGSLVAVWGASLIATGHPDGSARVWSIDTGEELGHFQGHVGNVFAVAFSPDAEYIVTGAEDTKAKLWRRSTGEDLRTYHGHAGAVIAVDFSADGQYLATGSTDASVKLYAREGDSEAPVVGSTGTFDLQLGLGLNMISMPVRPEAPLTASSFLDRLGGTMMVRLSQEEQQFEAFLPNSGFGDGFPIVGGEGYIVNVTEPTTVSLTGTVWVSAPTRSASEPSAPWAYVVAGTAPTGEDGSTRSVVIENPRTGSRATTSVRDDGRFIAALVDMNREPVASVGDELVAWASDGDGALVSRRLSHRISTQDATSATVRLVLRAAPTPPSEPLLLANFPNPFNPETWIPFALAESGPVAFTIYDVRGRSVRRLHLGDLPAAWYDTRDTAAYWDGRNDAGERVVSGVYIAELTAGDQKARQRMVMRK